MKITGITAQQRDKNRINIFVDGKYRFSLDILQLSGLGIHVGKEYSDEEMAYLEEESQFGKVYTRALEYVLTRPRSAKEVRDYLYRKTRDTRTKTGEIKKGVSQELTVRVFDRLNEKKYINDTSFARFWAENRNLRKGISRRKLAAELMAKGVDRTIIEEVTAESGRSEEDELAKIIAKKRSKYDDEQKLIAYLARQGFSYDDIQSALRDEAY